jgi:hypothetical protein
MVRAFTRAAALLQSVDRNHQPQVQNAGAASAARSSSEMSAPSARILIERLLPPHSRGLDKGEQHA